MASGLKWNSLKPLFIQEIFFQSLFYIELMKNIMLAFAKLRV